MAGRAVYRLDDGVDRGDAGPLPLRLGRFEASCIATLRLLGAPFEVAFAATMLMRFLTFWLPLVPGLLLTRDAMAEP